MTSVRREPHHQDVMPPHGYDPAMPAESPPRVQHMVVHRRGTGEPVLLVHGITTYSFIWQDVADVLERTHDVMTVDLAGCGRADMSLEVDHSLPAHAERLIAMLDELDIPQVHLVAHDVGGGIAQIMAVRYPERLIDMTLVNPIGYDYWPVQPISLLRAPILRQLAIAILDRSVMAFLVRRGLHNSERVTDELMHQFMMPLRSREGRKAFLQFARSLDNNDLMSIVDSLRELPVPTLVVRGQGDVYLSGMICERLAQDIPKARLLSFEHAGHFIQLDIPVELATVIREFIQEHDGG